MAIIDKILKRKPESKSDQLQRRLAQLAGLSQSDLEIVVVGEEASNIRSEAILRLNFGSTLISACSSSSPASLIRSAYQRVADLLDGQSLTIDEVQPVLSLSQRESVAALLANDDLVEPLLSDLTDENSLLRVGKENPSARIRQWAAEKLIQEQSQEALLKFSKGKDKAVYKLMKTKLDLVHEKEKQQLELRTKIDELMSVIKKHSQSRVDPLYRAKRDHLHQQWLAVAERANDEVSAIVEACFLASDNALSASEPDAHEPDIKDVVVEVSVPNDVDVEKNQQQRNELLAGIRKILLSLIESTETIDREYIELNIRHIQGRWQELQSQLPADDADNKIFEQLHVLIDKELANNQSKKHIKRECEKLLGLTVEIDNHILEKQEQKVSVFQRRLNSFKQSSLSSEVLDQIVSKFDEWLVERKKIIEQQQSLARRIGGLIKKSQAALREGKTGQAQGIRATIQEKSVKFINVPKYIDKQLSELDEQLGKVKDWKDYAVLPKKQSLLEKMQTLVGVNTSPDALATKIKRLQDEWKTLSRGGFSDDGELWEQFREAGDKAYEPCAAYFKAQAEIRKGNLQKRERLVDQLIDYNGKENWEKPDWKNVAKLVQVAFNEWRAYQPVERAANKIVQDKFDDIIGQIRGKLDAEHQDNKEQKKSLIDQAQQLAEAEDNRQAIDKVKQLQAQWKLIGSASHKSDQSLWKQFRKRCDQVFEKRKQLSAEFKVQLGEHKTTALGLCEELAQLSNQDLDTMLAGRERVQEIQQQFRDIGSLPKAQADDIQKRFKLALDSFDKALKQKQVQAKAGAWDAVLKAYDDVRQYSLTVRDEAAPTTEQLDEDALFEKTSSWPKQGEATLKQLLKNLSTNVEALWQDVTDTQRHLLCIRAEILAGLESPKEDSNLRMDYQVKQLAKGFGQGRQQHSNGKEALSAMLLEWISLPGIKAENYSALLDRMICCRQKIGI